MTLTSITRTTSAKIKIRHYDDAGLPSVPPSATIKLRYRDLNNEVVLIEAAMTQVNDPKLGPIFQYIWDSTPAAPGAVSGHIHSDGAEPCGTDFSFMVKANPANVA